MIGEKHDYTLSALAMWALRTSAGRCVDYVRDDMMGASEPGKVGDINYLHRHLPRKHLPRYDATFFDKFGLAVFVTGWKMIDPEHWFMPGSVAEELAARMIASEAIAALELVRDERDLDGRLTTTLRSRVDAAADEIRRATPLMCTDDEVEALFDMSEDGLEHENLVFDKWFLSMSRAEGLQTHPYFDTEHEEEPLP